MSQMQSANLLAGSDVGLAVDAVSIVGNIVGLLRLRRARGRSETPVLVLSRAGKG